MSAGVFILILVVAIAALVLMIVKAKMHPVLALFIAALGTGIALGYGVTGSVDYISNGFGGTLGSVGITIILGAIISMAIEDTGAAKVIANFFIKLFRGKRMELAPALTAFIMSIPVFGDITMVLTAPIASMLSKRKHISMSTMASFTVPDPRSGASHPRHPGHCADVRQRSGYDHRLGSGHQLRGLLRHLLSAAEVDGEGVDRAQS